MADGNCAKCGEPREGKHRYCRACFANYMRDWRKAERDRHAERDARLAELEALLGKQPENTQ